MNLTRRCTFILTLYLYSVFRNQGYELGECPTSGENFLNVTCGSLVVQCGTKYNRELVTPSPKITFPAADTVNITNPAKVQRYHSM